MTRGLPPTRRDHVVSSLRERIHSGQLKPGDRLAGETQLAAEFDVSRGTVRQALQELHQQNLIATRMGVGSFVAFDGIPLDAELGWAKALAATGRDLRVEVHSIEEVGRAAVPTLPLDVPLLRAVAIRRIRRMADGTAVSFESSALPAQGSLARLVDEGLPEQSITVALQREGLRATTGTQVLEGCGLPAREAEILGRPAGTMFLRSIRTALTQEGRLVEHVVSYLDPDHFRFQLRLGGA